jgi:hypothetical protein
MSTKNEARKLRHKFEDLQHRSWRQALEQFDRDQWALVDGLTDKADANRRAQIEAFHAAQGERVQWDDKTEGATP